MSGPSQPPGKGFITPTKHRRSRGSLHATPRSAAPSQPSEEDFVTPKKHRSRRRRGSLHATPRSAAFSLGRQRTSPEIDTQGLEMNLFDISSPRSPPPTDPMADFYQQVSVGVGEYTQSIEQDLDVLKESGFIIDYKNGFLGNGFFGEVFRGVYGPNASKLKDLKGNPLKNVGEGQPFAVKFVDFLAQEKDKKTFHALNQTLEKRESYEMEKYIMTFVDHPNITTIRMAVNMGEPREFQYQKADPPKSYIQHDRVYLFMDLAQLGSLMEYVKRHLEPFEQFKLVRDCFAGLKYLHDQNMVHGDIHMGNILVFEEEGEVIAKWTDFGLAYVSGQGEYSYNSRARKKEIDRYMVKRTKTDLENFSIVVKHIMRGSEHIQKYSPDIQHMVKQYFHIVDTLKNAKTLAEVIQQYHDVLGYRERMV